MAQEKEDPRTGPAEGTERVTIAIDPEAIQRGADAYSWLKGYDRGFEAGRLTTLRDVFITIASAIIVAMIVDTFTRDL